MARRTAGEGGGGALVDGRGGGGWVGMERLEICEYMCLRERQCSDVTRRRLEGGDASEADGSGRSGWVLRDSGSRLPRFRDPARMPGRMIA